MQGSIAGSVSSRGVLGGRRQVSGSMPDGAVGSPTQGGYGAMEQSPGAKSGARHVRSESCTSISSLNFGDGPHPFGVAGGLEGGHLFESTPEAPESRPSEVEHRFTS
jgi:hypothetical protein